MYYENRQESLGQIRFDRTLSDDIYAPILIQTGNIEGKDYVKDIHGAPMKAGLNQDTDQWQALSKHGTVAWRFGLGDIVTIYDT